MTTTVTYHHCSSTTTTNVTETTCQAIIIPCSADGRIVNKSIMARIVGSNKQWFAHYKAICASGQFTAGRAYPLRDGNGVVRVVLLAIKQKINDAPDIAYVEHGMRELLIHFRSVGIRSIATVKIGCNASAYSLKWSEVGYLLASTFQAMQIQSEIYIGEHDAEIYPICAEDIAERQTMTMLPAIRL